MVSSSLSETQRGIIDTVRVINVFVVQGPLHALLVGGLNNIRRGQSVHTIARELDHLEQTLTEVYISSKIYISARTLKMAPHKNPVMHCDRVVIFLHGSQKKAFSLHN